MTPQWYALQSKPLKESFLAEQLERSRIECYYPRLRVKPVNPRSRKVKPYFPGYVFSRVDLAEVGLSLLQWMPGSVGLVSFGGAPASVPDGLIALIRERVDEINAAGGEQLKHLQRGELVTIQAGPFQGYEAIFDCHISGNERVRVLLRLLNRQHFPLELPGSYIEQKNVQRGLRGKIYYR
jgi:transcriptional antiterminator RfaH